MRPNSSANRQSNSKSANAMPRPIMPSAPPRHQPRRAAFGRDRSRRSLRKYNGGLNVAPPPHGSCFLLFSVWCCFWCFRLSLLRVRRPWPGPCTRAGAGAGPHPAARTTPPPHFKGKTVNNCTAGHRKARPALGAENPATSQGPNNAARKNRGPPITHGTEFHGLPNRRPMGAPRNSKALVEIHPALLIIAYE